MTLARKWVTMGDVARRAGVGTITVSRALRTPDKVSPETRARIEAAVAELGYVRDETAGALSSQRSRIVGALVSTLEEPVFASTLRGLSEGLARGGLHLLLGDTGYRPETEAALVSALLGRRPEALVMTSTVHAEATRSLLAGAGIPVIELWELPETPLHAAIGFSNRAAGRALAEHLYDTGRRRVAFLGLERTGDTRGPARRDGYLDALGSRHGARIESPAARPGLTGPEAGAQALRSLLQRWPDTDGVVCVNDALALGARCEAGRMGREVPRDLAIAGFGDYDASGPSGLDLTTIRIDGAAIGRKAAALTLAAAGGEDIAGRVIDMGFTLLRRGST